MGMVRRGKGRRANGREMTPAEWENLGRAVDFLVEPTGSIKTVIARSDLYCAVINYAWDTPLWVLQPRYSRNASRLREKAVLSLLRDKGLVLGSEKALRRIAGKTRGFSSACGSLIRGQRWF